MLLRNFHLINEFGGSDGIRDHAALESAVARPQSGNYNDIVEGAASLMESLAMNHPFVDGNKRIAFFTADGFLQMNGFEIRCDDEEATPFLLDYLNPIRVSLRSWLLGGARSFT